MASAEAQGPQVPEYSMYYSSMQGIDIRCDSGVAVVLDCEDEEQWRSHDQLWTAALPSSVSWKTIGVARGENLSENALWKAKGIIITGSHHCATDESLPWRAGLVTTLQNLVRSPVPAGHERPRIVGVCFGCQILADALGGKAGPNPSGEFVLKCETWELCGTPASMPAYNALQKATTDTAPRIIETHGDCVLQLPPDGHVLAKSVSCKHELFTISTHVLGLQGHPEFNADEVMEKIYPDVASLPGVQGRSEQSIHDELKSTVGTATVIDFVYAFLCLDSKSS